MTNHYFLFLILIVFSGAVRGADTKQSIDFASEIDSELGEIQAVADTRTVARPDPEMEGWTVDGFLKSINRAGSETAAPVDVPVEAVIKEAATRGARQAKKSPYLDAVSAEASDLSVNAVDTANVTGLIRNQPSIGRIEYSQNLIEIGGRVIRDGYIIVKQGDSLTLIAAQVYGDANRYDEIFAANKDLLVDPDVVTAGIKLYIPIQ